MDFLPLISGFFSSLFSTLTYTGIVEENYLSMLMFVDIQPAFLLLHLCGLLALIGFYFLYTRKSIRKLASLNEQLQESNEKYQAVVEQSAEAIFIHRKGKFVFANHIFYELSGYNESELKDLRLIDLVHPEDHEKIVEVFKKSGVGLKSPNLFEVKVVTKTNKTRIVELRSNMIRYEKEPAILVIVNDITTRKENLETIRKLSMAVQQSPVSIVITNHDGIIEYVNETFSKVTGYSFADVIGKAPSLWKSGQMTNSQYEELWKTIKGSLIWKGEILNKKKNGELFWASTVISPLMDGKGKISHFVGINEDITRRKKAEEALQNREKELQKANQDKDRLFSIIGHDLKSPFNSILGLSRLLVSDYDSFTDEVRKEFISSIDEACNNTYRLVENLLDWSRSQTGSIKYHEERFSLNILVKEAIQMTKSQADQKSLLVYDDLPENTEVMADKNMTRIILRNLISNAIKFTSNGAVKITAAQKENFNVICISDTGIGIPEERIRTLFDSDREYQLEGTIQEKGTGLGLILCKDLIEQSGGEIWVESVVNEGTKVCFTLRCS